MKILHLPTLVGNHGYSMAYTERLLGHDSKAVSITSNKNVLMMKTDESLELPTGIVKLPKIINFFLKNRKKYDVYHFNFGQSLLDFPNYGLDYLDLPFYSGKKVVTFNGSDARLPVLESINPFSPYLGVDRQKTNSYSFKRKAERIGKITSNVDTCFALNPDLMRFLPEGQSIFLPYIKKIWFDVNKVESRKLMKGQTIKIVHAPTNRDLKGTNEIIDAINDLKMEYNIDFILIEGMTHSLALEHYQSADLVIDQIKLGWYGGFALEVMRMGIPVVVYINKLDLKYVDNEMADSLLSSVINVTPLNIKTKLSILFDDPSLINKLARKSFDYVTKFHNPKVVMNKVIKHYKS